MKWPARLRQLARRFLGNLPALGFESQAHPRGRPRPPRLIKDSEAYTRYDVGDWSYGTPRVYSWDNRTVLRIGKFCSISDGVTILLGGEHRTDWITTYPFGEFFPDNIMVEGHPRTKGDISIGNDVWIGMNALLLSGVIIGDGAVIAAGAVVTGDVPPYAIYAGNPARLVRLRFSPDVIDILLRIKWWDWPIDKVKEVLPLLLSDNMDAFIERYHVD